MQQPAVELGALISAEVSVRRQARNRFSDSIQDARETNRPGEERPTIREVRASTSKSALDTSLDLEKTCNCNHITMPEDVASSTTKLTDRQCEVLILLGSSMSNRQVGHRLGITERTVKAHVNQILERLNLKTRLEAALVAVLYHRHICLDRAAMALMDDDGLSSQRRVG